MAALKSGRRWDGAPKPFVDRRDGGALSAWLYPDGVAIPKIIPHTVCVVPRNWTQAQISSRCCSDQSHMHIDRATIAEAAELNIVAWLSYPRRNRERGIARWLRQIPIRGMSCKLAGFDTEKMPEWAKVMLANIRMERECASV